MSEQTGKVDDSQSQPKIKKKFRKGDLVKVDREKYSNSLESKRATRIYLNIFFKGLEKYY